MDVVRRGLPVVVAGADRLDVPVRWVHAVEVTDDVARLLRGGELILSTGIALPESDSALASYVAELAAAGVAGLAIELGRRYSVSLPSALVAAAAASGVVLIEFRAEVAFVELTEAVHTRIFEARAQLPDQRLRGLLYQLRDDPRVRAFADRELGALVSYDAAHGTRLVGDLAAFLEAGGNKALAASRAHMARPTFYQRLRVIEAVLGVSLADAESRASLPRIPSSRSPRPTTPPIANPLARTLPKVMKSGVTSCASMPQKCSPVRPQPVCTSSEMSRMPCSSRTSLYALNRPSAPS